MSMHRSSSKDNMKVGGNVFPLVNDTPTIHDEDRRMANGAQLVKSFHATHHTRTGEAERTLAARTI